MHSPDACTYSRPIRSSQTAYQSLTRREISQTIIDNTSLCLSPSFKYVFIYVYVLHSSRRHTSTIGLTKTESLVFNSTVLTLQSLPRNTLVMIAIGHWPLGVFLSPTNTKSPTRTFRCTLNHFCRRCNVVRYSLIHLF